MGFDFFYHSKGKKKNKKTKKNHVHKKAILKASADKRCGSWVRQEDKSWSCSKVEELSLTKLAHWFSSL